MYKPIISQLYYENPTTKTRTIHLISKFLGRIDRNESKTINRMIINKRSDQEILGKLRTEYLKIHHHIMNSGERGIRNAAKLISIYKSVCHNIDSSKIKYLDIGSNNGTITVEFGKQLGLSKDQINGIDIESFGNQKIVPVEGFNFIVYDGVNIPFPDETFNIITCSMILHHVKDKDELIKRINRVLVKGGVFIIKEHDAQTFEDKELIFLEHALYELYEQNFDYDEFRETYDDHTVSKHEIVSLIESNGFVNCNINNESLHLTSPKFNPTKYYYAAFVKK